MEQKVILLACAAGMSTSLLVTKMQEVSKKDKIFAIPVSKVDQKVNEESIDVILIGPQIRYMEKRIKDISPDTIVHKYTTFYLPENRDTFDFTNYDYIVDAIDTVTAKIDMICYAKSVKTPIISCMGCGNRMDPTQLELTDIYKTKNDPLAKVMRHELKKRHINKCKVVCSKELPVKTHYTEQDSKKRSVPGSTAFVPSAAGLICASYIVRKLIK